MKIDGQFILSHDLFILIDRDFIMIYNLYVVNTCLDASDAAKCPPEAG